jgi:hypothetical protein
MVEAKGSPSFVLKVTLETILRQFLHDVGLIDPAPVPS